MESHAFCNFIVTDIRNMSTNSKEFAILVSIWQYVKINNSQHTQMLYGKSQGYGGLRAGNIHPNGYLFIETGPFFREVRPLLTDWLHFGQKQFGIFVIFTIGIIINFGQIFAVLGQFSLGSSTYISWIHGILFQQIINLIRNRCIELIQYVSCLICLNTKIFSAHIRINPFYNLFIFNIIILYIFEFRIK